MSNLPAEKHAEEFKPTIESLTAYKCPEWFRDAKFGIYLHWGVYSVAERGEWYARRLYMEGTPEYEHHVKTYGHPSKFGYKDFIAMWKAEKFDPDRLVRLFKQAGARYFTPCAIHHDNFDLWDSKHHKWNSVNMGPRKDITGMWREATLKHGLRFGVTTHLARSYSWFNVNKGADSKGPHKGVPYDGNDPAYRDFYHELHDDTDCGQPVNPPAGWRKAWALRIKDLIDNYQPDHLYFDGALPFRGDDNAQTGLEVVAYYYNQDMRRHGGNQECVMCIKDVHHHGLYVEGAATLDMERRRADELLPDPWQTDTSIGPWGYHAGAAYRPVREMIHELVDIVSKNGNVLLNVPPRADGTLDEQTEKILADIGKWLDVNGEAIYQTRPWATFGESPAQEAAGGNKQPAGFTAQDIRFTTSGRTLYAIVLDWPGKDLSIRSLGTDAGLMTGQIAEVRLLGCDEPLTWRRGPEALTVRMPERKPCEHAFALKVSPK